MKRKHRSVVRRPLLSPQTMELLRGGVELVTQLGPVGWIAVVAIVAMALSGYAMHVVMAVAMKG